MDTLNFHRALKQIADNTVDGKYQAVEFVPNDGHSYKSQAIEFTEGDKIAPENRKYLLLLRLYIEDSNIDAADTFKWIVGRQEVYDYLKNLIKSDAIDIEESEIVTETTRLVERITIHRFMRMMFDEHLVEDEDGFDIDEYQHDNTEADSMEMWYDPDMDNLYDTEN